MSHHKDKRSNSVWMLVVALLSIMAVWLTLVVFLGRGSRVKSNPISGESSAHSDRRADLTVITTKRTQQQINHLESRLDPTHDGWETEALAEQAKHCLVQLLESLIDKKNQNQDLGRFVSEEFSCPSLQPKMEVTFQDTFLTVRQATTKRTDPAANNERYVGLEGLSRALEMVGDDFNFNSQEAFQVVAKIVGLEKTADTLQTQALIELSGVTETGRIESHAVWNCEWLFHDHSIRLSSIDILERSDATTASRVWFSDQTSTVLGENPSFNTQLTFGLNHWLRRIGRVQGIHVFARWGIAIGDCNGDGYDDIYACQPGGLPNRLFLQQPDGTAIDVSAEAGVDWLDHTGSALFVDLDNDNDQDLVLGTQAGLLLMENDSQGHFRHLRTLPPKDVDLQSLSAVDYDLDGDLDLYVCIDFENQQALRGESTGGFVYHNANDGGANALFRNDIARSNGTKNDDWQFTDVTQQVGLEENNRRHSLAAAWEDFDNDNDQDLYVANDYGQNCLYRNDNGRFTDIASTTNVVDFGSGMSVSWADFNRDGRMDLYVGNMFSSAGSRVTRQPGFKAGSSDELRSIYSRFAKGNSLFANQTTPGDLAKFQEVSAQAGVQMGRWAWSSIFADLNNDGWQDLVVGNGYITAPDPGDL